MSKKDFENMSPKEIEDYFGVTQEQIEEWDDMLVRGGRSRVCRSAKSLSGAPSSLGSI